LAWICVLKEIGEVSDEDLNRYYDNGSRFAGHPKKGSCPFVTWSTGSLGHGLSVACGKAMAKPDSHYIVILGDGECNEGSIWEGLMFMSQHRLGNITVIIDNNKQESLDLTRNILDIENLQRRLSGFNFMSKRINGHDLRPMVELLSDRFGSNERFSPLVIIADTVKGKGVSFMEAVPMWHHRKLTDIELFTAVSEVRQELQGS
jgi:transketolase